MKVLFYNRDNAIKNFGGDTVQMLKTKLYLEKLHGVSVTIGGLSELKFQSFDLVHFFNIRCPQDIIAGVRYCKTNQIKYCISTIYGSYREGDIRSRDGFISLLATVSSENSLEYFKVLARILKVGGITKSKMDVLLKGYYTCQLFIASNAQMLLPNSDTEALLVAERFKVDPSKIRVVVNGFDHNVFSEPLSTSEIEKEWITCVARIENRKGQLDLVRAAKHFPNEKFLIVGKASEHGSRYMKQVLKEAPSNVVFRGFVDHDELLRIYSTTKIHILPSWIETPGLSSLEAGALGCTLLVTDRGDTPWYFGDRVYYCEPGNFRSIERSIRNALRSPKSCSEHVRRHFTWVQTANETFAAYNEILAS